MRYYTKEDFTNAVVELVSTIVEQHSNEIEAIYAGGSFARGDFVPGRSDVDLYVVSKTSCREELQKKLAQEVRQVEKKYFSDLRLIHGEVLSIAVTTLDEIMAGRSFLGTGFEYHNFIAQGKLLWGNDVRSIIPRPSREAERESAQNYLNKAFGLVSQWAKQAGSPTHENKERLARQAFSSIFRTAAFLLCGNGEYVGDKEEIFGAFERTFPSEKELKKILSCSLTLWEEWKTRPLSNKEIEQLLCDSLRFVEQLKTLF